MFRSTVCPHALASVVFLADFYPKPDWSAFRDGSAYGSGRLSIRNSALALWEWTVRSFVFVSQVVGGGCLSCVVCILHLTAEVSA